LVDENDELDLSADENEEDDEHHFNDQEYGEENTSLIHREGPVYEEDE